MSTDSPTGTLDEPISNQQTEDLNSRLANHLGGDERCIDAGRILRVPDTWRQRLTVDTVQYSMAAASTDPRRTLRSRHRSRQYSTYHGISTRRP